MVQILGKLDLLCFNTQPPEGGWVIPVSKSCANSWFQHTAARRRLEMQSMLLMFCMRFQHTAARRRLAVPTAVKEGDKVVSTHSRPKAAGRA